MNGQRRASGPKQRHHRIPTKYLEGFFYRPNGLEKQSLLWIYKWGKDWNPGEHRNKNNPSLTGIRLVASERSAYAFVTPQGGTDIDTIENLLQKKETRTDKVLQKLRAGEPVSYAEKGIFAEYIQLTYKRTFERDRRMRNTTEKVVTGFPWNSIVLQLALQGDFGNARKLAEMQRYFESEEGKKHC